MIQSFDKIKTKINFSFKKKIKANAKALIFDIK